MPLWGGRASTACCLRPPPASSLPAETAAPTPAHICLCPLLPAVGTTLVCPATSALEGLLPEFTPTSRLRSSWLLKPLSEKEEEVEG